MERPGVEQFAMEDMTNHSFVVTSDAPTQRPRAIGKNVIVRVETIPERTKAGIILEPIRRAHDEMHQGIGIIVEFGPYALHQTTPEKWGVRVGDTIIFAKNVGKNVYNELPTCDKNLRIIRDEDIQARVDPIEVQDG